VIIAIDFDETYNRDPGVFDKIIENFWEAKHRVYMVTYRHETLDPDPLLEELRIPIIYTDGKAKGPFTEDLGIKVDIWIEDNPRAVHEDSAWKQDSPELHAWREENKKKINFQPLKKSA
jgi:hypothetical protein